MVNRLNRHQYVYQVGKSCEMSIHDLALKIENTLVNKEIALGVFLDIKGAFDNTSFDSINKAVEGREAGRSISEWLDAAIRNRKVTATLGTVCRKQEG